MSEELRFFISRRIGVRMRLSPLADRLSEMRTRILPSILHGICVHGSWVMHTLPVWIIFLLEKPEMSVLTRSMGKSKYVSSPDGLGSNNISRRSPSSPNNQPR